MSRSIDPEPPAPDADEVDSATAAATRPTVDLATLPIVGLTRRRIAMIAAAMLAAWIVIAFARQVAEASEAATRAQDIASGNAMLSLEVAAMERELESIGRQRFVEQEARAHGVGGSTRSRSPSLRIPPRSRRMPRARPLSGWAPRSRMSARSSAG